MDEKFKIRPARTFGIATSFPAPKRRQRAVPPPPRNLFGSLDRIELDDFQICLSDLSLKFADQRALMPNGPRPTILVEVGFDKTSRMIRWIRGETFCWYPGSAMTVGRFPSGAIRI